LFLAAAFMCSTILGFADAEGLTSLNVFTLAYLVITLRAIPISDRLVYYDEVIAKRSGMMMECGFSKCLRAVRCWAVCRDVITG
jgi:hypothetical protein